MDPLYELKVLVEACEGLRDASLWNKANKHSQTREQFGAWCKRVKQARKRLNRGKETDGPRSDALELEATDAGVGHAH